MMTMMMMSSKDYVEWAKELAARGRAMTLEESLIKIDKRLKKTIDPCARSMLIQRRKRLVEHFKTQSSKKDTDENC